MLQGKTALVTGSTGGIGLGIACSLITQDANIIMNSFDDVRAPEAQIAAASKSAIRAEYHGADMNKPAGIEAMLAYADAEFGGVDTLVSNTGIQCVANIRDFPAEHRDAIIATNLTSAFHTTQLAVSGMKHKDWGRIINVASVHGLVALAQESVCVAVRHGIVGFIKSVALETARTGITPSAICPGWVLTPLVQKQIDAHAERGSLSVLGAKTDLLTEKQPSCEFATPDQLGTLTAFLCSDATGQVCGVAWNVDSG